MKAFLFDMDGVLVDTQQIHTLALKKIFEEYGIEISMEELASFAGTKRGTALRKAAEERGVSLPIEEMCDAKDRLFDAMIEKTDLKPIQGIPELLEQLKRDGVLTAIASSSSRDFISLVVDRTGIRQYFDAFISGQELPESKPNPAIYLLAAQTLGVEPSECIVLEDAHLGVEAAKRAGMRCIGYRNPNSGAQDLSKADVVVDRMEKIIRMIGTL